MSNRNIKLAIFGAITSVLLLGSTVAASANDLPGEPLYPIKLAAENATLALSFSNEAKASKLLNMVTERVTELEDINEYPNKTTDEDLVDKTEELLVDELDDLAEIGESISNDSKIEIIEKLLYLDARHDTVMARVYEQVPEQAKPSIQKALENSKRGHIRAIEALSKEHGKDNAPGQDSSRHKGKDAGNDDVDFASDDAAELESIDEDDSDDNDSANVEDDQDPENIEENDDSPSSNNSSKNNGNGNSDNSY